MPLFGIEFLLMMSAVLAFWVVFYVWIFTVSRRYEAAISLSRKRWGLRNKLEFAVSLSRNGGYWKEHGETRRNYRVSPGGPVFEVYKNTYRWQPA